MSNKNFSLKHFHLRQFLRQQPFQKTLLSDLKLNSNLEIIVSSVQLCTAEKRIFFRKNMKTYPWRLDLSKLDWEPKGDLKADIDPVC